MISDEVKIHLCPLILQASSSHILQTLLLFSAHKRWLVLCPLL